MRKEGVRAVLWCAHSPMTCYNIQEPVVNWLNRWFVGGGRRFLGSSMWQSPIPAWTALDQCLNWVQLVHTCAGTELIYIVSATLFNGFVLPV